MSTSSVTHTDSGSEMVLRARADPHRPTYHFVSPAGWLNDPNGVAQRDGTYHLFYQYNPVGPFHDRIHWGHAVSADLMHWSDRPIALEPGQGPDREGCWSGVLVDDGGVPTLVYSGRADGQELPCLAVGSADLDTWQPLDVPVIGAPPEGWDLTAYRDHCVWREDGEWRQLIGSGVAGRGGCAFLYASDDLRTWRLLGPLTVHTAGPVALDDPEWTGTMWECVDFFRLTPGPQGRTAPPAGDSTDPHLLIFSAWHDEHTLHPLVAIGRYDGRQFEIDQIQRLDLGGRHAYAPQSFADESGRRVLWAWMQEARSDTATKTAGWSGAMITPRRLWLDPADDTTGADARYVVRSGPVAEVAALRQETLDSTPTDPTGRGRELDLEVEVTLPAGSALDIVVLATPDRAEHTALHLSRVDGVLTLTLDRSRSSLDPDVDRSPGVGVIPGAAATFRIRVLIDRSSIEVFVNDIALSTRVYPTRPDADRFLLEPLSGAEIHHIRAWRMAGTEAPQRSLRPAP